MSRWVALPIVVCMIDPIDPIDPTDPGAAGALAVPVVAVTPLPSLDDERRLLETLEIGVAAIDAELAALDISPPCGA